MWDKLFYSLLKEIHILCYQTPCHNHFHLAAIFKSMVTKILINCWKWMLMTLSAGGLVKKIMCHVNLFSE